MLENLDISEKWIESNSFCSHTTFWLYSFPKSVGRKPNIRGVIYPQYVFEPEGRCESPCIGPDTHSSWQVGRACLGFLTKDLLTQEE